MIIVVIQLIVNGTIIEWKNTQIEKLQSNLEDERQSHKKALDAKDQDISALRKRLFELQGTDNALSALTNSQLRDKALDIANKILEASNDYRAKSNELIYS